jgi:hypothetical protein
MTCINITLELGEDLTQFGTVDDADVENIVRAFPTHLVGGVVTIRFGDGGPAHVAGVAVADNLQFGHRTP